MPLAGLSVCGLKLANFDFVITDPIFFCGFAIRRFHAKANWLHRHMHTPFPGQKLFIAFHGAADNRGIPELLKINNVLSAVRRSTSHALQQILYMYTECSVSNNSRNPR